MSDYPQDVNTIQLRSLAEGEIDPESMKRLFATCHNELRTAARHLMKNERSNHTLQPTALVNEAYLRLFNINDIPLTGRAHFVKIAARSMRQILVEHARRRNAAKRSGGWQAVTLTGLNLEAFNHEMDLLELNDALSKLADLDSRVVEVVELRIFGGMTMEEIAVALNLTRRTVQKDWRFATMWLRREFLGPIPDPA